MMASTLQGELSGAKAYKEPDLGSGSTSTCLCFARAHHGFVWCVLGGREANGKSDKPTPLKH